MAIIGSISKDIQKLLDFKIKDDNRIYLNSTNLALMQLSHPDDFDNYKDKIPIILAAPDYVGINPSYHYIEYVTEFYIDTEPI